MGLATGAWTAGTRLGRKGGELSMTICLPLRMRGGSRYAIFAGSKSCTHAQGLEGRLIAPSLPLGARTEVRGKQEAHRVVDWLVADRL
jgi:hypothetical protein